MQNNISKNIFTIPNILSLVRLCLIPLFMWLYLVKADYPMTVVVLILSGVTDIADGFIARHFNMISDFGKILDPIADKLTQFCLAICLFTRFPLMLLPILLMVIKEFFLGITGYMVINKTGIVHGANWHGKVNTCLLYAMMILHVIWYNIPHVLSAVSVMVCLAMMIASMTLYGRDNVKAINCANRQQPEGIPNE